MTQKQYQDAQNVVNEIKEIEKFLPIFEACPYNRLITTQRAETTLDREKEISFRILKGDYISSVIVDSMKKRLKELKDIFEKM